MGPLLQKRGALTSASLEVVQVALLIDCLVSQTRDTLTALAAAQAWQPSNKRCTSIFQSMYSKNEIDCCVVRLCLTGDDNDGMDFAEITA
jgi:hypothetical protein